MKMHLYFWIGLTFTWTWTSPWPTTSSTLHITHICVTASLVVHHQWKCTVRFCWQDVGMVALSLEFFLLMKCKYFHLFCIKIFIRKLWLFLKLKQFKGRLVIFKKIAEEYYFLNLKNVSGCFTLHP